MLCRGFAALVLVVLPWLLIVLAADFPDPGPRRDAILKRFVAELVPLTPGHGKFPASFTLGSTGDAPAAEKPAVKVTLAAPFALARYEVTQELYQVVMGINPSKWTGSRNSVEMVSWDQANDFCRKLTDALRKDKLLAEDEVIRLPSEAEWEYACRAGSTTRYCFGDAASSDGLESSAGDLKDYAWFKGNSKGEDPPVGKKKPNAWGLYDMHGYVWEWCADAWHPSHEGASTDGKPRRDKDVKERVIRGGSWADDADASRSAFRAGKPAGTRSDTIGFRCVKAKEDRK
jgi:formylglycine-generating enzyme required for sulfatase activity